MRLLLEWPVDVVGVVELPPAALNRFQHQRGFIFIEANRHHVVRVSAVLPLLGFLLECLKGLLLLRDVGLTGGFSSRVPHDRRIGSRERALEGRQRSRDKQLASRLAGCDAGVLLHRRLASPKPPSATWGHLGHKDAAGVPTG